MSKVSKQRYVERAIKFQFEDSGMPNNYYWKMKAKYKLIHISALKVGMFKIRSDPINPLNLIYF